MLSSRGSSWRIPWTEEPVGLSRQEFWSELPCPPPGDLPTQGLNTSPVAPALQVDSLLPSQQRTPHTDIKLN